MKELVLLLSLIIFLSFLLTFPIYSQLKGIFKFEKAKGASSIAIIFSFIIISSIFLYVILQRVKIAILLWYYFASSIAILVSTSFLGIFSIILAITLSLLDYYLRDKNFLLFLIFHNIFAILSYHGIALIFLNFFSIETFLIFLFFLAIYDFIAVYKTKHMVEIAKDLIELKILPGIFISYQENSLLIGSGDITFSLVFLYLALFSQKYFLFLISLVSLSTILPILLFFKARKGTSIPLVPFIFISLILSYFISKL